MNSSTLYAVQCKVMLTVQYKVMLKFFKNIFCVLFLARISYSQECLVLTFDIDILEFLIVLCSIKLGLILLEYDLIFMCIL